MPIKIMFNVCYIQNLFPIPCYLEIYLLGTILIIGFAFYILKFISTYKSIKSNYKKATDGRIDDENLKERYLKEGKTWIPYFGGARLALLLIISFILITISGIIILGAILHI
jgi:hypothetical protein